MTVLWFQLPTMLFVIIEATVTKITAILETQTMRDIEKIKKIKWNKKKVPSQITCVTSAALNILSWFLLCELHTPLHWDIKAIFFFLKAANAILIALCCYKMQYFSRRFQGKRAEGGTAARKSFTLLLFCSFWRRGQTAQGFLNVSTFNIFSPLSPRSRLSMFIKRTWHDVWKKNPRLLNCCKWRMKSSPRTRLMNVNALDVVLTYCDLPPVDVWEKQEQKKKKRK